MLEPWMQSTMEILNKDHEFPFTEKEILHMARTGIIHKPTERTKMPKCSGCHKPTEGYEFSLKIVNTYSLCKDCYDLIMITLQEIPKHPQPCTLPEALECVRLGQAMKTFSTNSDCELLSITYRSTENTNLVECRLATTHFFYTLSEAEFFLSSYLWIPAK
jgi:hypothetical protein